MGLQRFDLNDCIYRNLLTICLVEIIPCDGAYGVGGSYYFASGFIDCFAQKGADFRSIQELRWSALKAWFEAGAPRLKPSSPIHNNMIGRVGEYKLNTTLLICFHCLGKVERHQLNLFVPVSDGIVIAARIQHPVSNRVLPDFLAATIAIDEHRRRELVRQNTGRQNILRMPLSARDARSRAQDVRFPHIGLRSYAFRASAASPLPEVIGLSAVLVSFRPARADLHIAITPQLDEQRLSLL